MTDLQGLVNKTVDFRFRGADLKLDISHALFSSFDVDVGTKLLFKAVGRDEVIAGSRRVLDAGSGVGVIGLAVAAAFPDCRVTLRDRDLLAVAFSERNRRRNRLENARVEPGLIAASPAGGRAGGAWDCILSNVPAKAGGPVIRGFLEESRASLVPEGRLAIVVVKPLVEEVRAALAEAGFEVVGEERGAMHRAFIAKPTAKKGRAAIAVMGQTEGGVDGPGSTTPFDDPFAEGLHDLSLYRRSEADFKLFGKIYRARGYWGLPDFDTIGWPQLAAAELLSRFATGGKVEEALVVNPGLGHTALWIALALAPARLGLASRDLLSLLAARENLGGIEAPKPLLLDALRLDEGGEASLDLLLDFADPVPEYDWLGPTWARSARLLRRGGMLVVAGPPTELARLEKRRPEGWRLLGEKRKKGSVAVAWRRT